jgi:hypothetical protein
MLVKITPVAYYLYCAQCERHKAPALKKPTADLHFMNQRSNCMRSEFLTAVNIKITVS